MAQVVAFLNILDEFCSSFNPWRSPKFLPPPTTPQTSVSYPATTRHLIAKTLPQGQVPQGIFYRLAGDVTPANQPYTLDERLGEPFE